MGFFFSLFTIYDVLSDVMFRATIMDNQGYIPEDKGERRFSLNAIEMHGITRFDKKLQIENKMTYKLFCDSNLQQIRGGYNLFQAKGLIIGKFGRDPLW